MNWLIDETENEFIIKIKQLNLKKENFKLVRFNDYFEKVAFKPIIDSKLEKYSSWEDLDDSHETYEYECNYYEKAEDYYYPEMNKTKYLSIIGSALSKYFEEENITKNIVCIAMSKYLSEETS